MGWLGDEVLAKVGDDFIDGRPGEAGGVDQIDGEDGMRRLALGPSACGVAASIRQFSADKGCAQLGAQGGARLSVSRLPTSLVGLERALYICTGVRFRQPCGLH